MDMTILSIDSLDHALAGWRYSRSLEAAQSWDEVYTIDVPVNELPSAIVQCRGTILLREIFTSARNHIIWARTSHVDDPINFVVPEDLSHPSNELNRERMRSEKAEGLSQDEWRRHLPVTSLTSWTMRISFRDAVKLTGYLIYLAERIHHTDISLMSFMLTEAYEKMLLLVDSFTEDRSKSLVAIGLMQPVRFLYEGDLEQSRSAMSSQHMIACITAPLWFRAQVVRHRMLSFVDDFYQRFLNYPYVLQSTIEHQLKMELCAPKSVWRSVLGKRTCWLAQDELTGGKRDAWQAVIDSQGFSESMLPCADGHCPYHGDAMLRVKGDDPGVPCPEFCNIYNIEKTPEMKMNMRRASMSRHEHWRVRIERSLVIPKAS